MRIFYCSIVSLLLASCQSSEKGLKEAHTIVYTGDFSGSPIELTITMLDDSTVKGKSSHRGIISEMSGKRTTSSKGYAFHLKELGTSKYEGIFDFELDTSLQLIFGSWQLGDTNGSREAVLYTLQPQKN